MQRRTLRFRTLRLAVLTLLALAAASAAHAAIFTVTLTNGTTFITRYRPVPAEWDENVVMIHTDRGNWIGLRTDEIADVSSQAESSGFGYQLDTTTLFVGWSPNDVYDGNQTSGEPGEGGSAEGGMNLEEMYPEPPPSNVLEQFVDIPVQGGTLGGQAVDSIYYEQ